MIPDDCIERYENEGGLCLAVQPRSPLHDLDDAYAALERANGALMALGAQLDEACQRIRDIEDRLNAWLRLVYDGKVPSILKARQLPLPIGEDTNG